MSGSQGRFESELGRGATLSVVRAEDAEELFALVDASRMFLREWLPWVDANVSIAETQEFLRRSDQQLEDGDGFQCCIRLRERIAGVIGFYRVDWLHKSAEIGYWLAEEYQGRGLVTGAGRSLVRHAFGAMGVHRLEIRAGTENLRSRAVAERLGFREEGIQREAQRLGDRFVDLAVYGLLEHEWDAAAEGGT